MQFCPCNKACGLENTEIDSKNNKISPCTNFKYICEEGKPFCLNDKENDGSGDRNVNSDNKCEDPDEVPMCLNSNGSKILATKVCKNFGKSTGNCEPVFYQGQAQCGKMVQKLNNMDACSLLTNPLTMPPKCSCEFCGLSNNCKYTCSKGKPMCKNSICSKNEQPWCKDYKNGKLISYGIKATKKCFIKEPGCNSVMKNGKLVCEGPCKSRIIERFTERFTETLGYEIFLFVILFLIFVLGVKLPRFWPKRRYVF